MSRRHTIVHEWLKDEKLWNVLPVFIVAVGNELKLIRKRRKSFATHTHTYSVRIYVILFI